MQEKKIKILTTAKNSDSLPSYASPEAAGADIRACLDEPIIIQPGERALIPTGLKFEIPPGYEVQIRPRSGLALKHGVTVLNTPGTIDSDYRGEVKVILINHGNESFEVTPNMRIAQMIAAPVCQAEFVYCKELKTSTRGAGGFGHTGLN